MPETITAQVVAEKNPEIAKHFREEGAKAERERIQSVEAQALPGHEALIQSLKFDGKTTGPEAAVKVLSAEREKGAKVLGQLAAESPAPIPPAKEGAESLAGKSGLTEKDKEAQAEKLIAKIQKEEGCDRRTATRKASKVRPDLFGLVVEEAS